MALLSSHPVAAQSRFFNTVNMQNSHGRTACLGNAELGVSGESNAEEKKGSTDVTESNQVDDTATPDDGSAKTIVTAGDAHGQEKTFTVGNSKNKGKGSVPSSLVKKQGSYIISLYQGESHPLTIGNVLKVMDEVGISNQLFVLAQSLLETGFYKSNVCKTKNNLFGLRMRSGAYMAFDSWESSVVGYQKYVQYKYKGGSYLAFLRRIGYAEDPHYISKVIKMSRWITQNYGA